MWRIIEFFHMQCPLDHRLINIMDFATSKNDPGTSGESSGPSEPKRARVQPPSPDSSNNVIDIISDELATTSEMLSEPNDNTIDLTRSSDDDECGRGFCVMEGFGNIVETDNPFRRMRIMTNRSLSRVPARLDSVMLIAASAGYFDMVQFLIKMRENIEERSFENGNSPLMEASIGGYDDIVNLLLSHGANVNAKSLCGNTALSYACVGGHEKVAELLINAGADFNMRNENHRTPLMEAASAGRFHIVKYLVERGAPMSAHYNDVNESALTLACANGHVDVVAFLLNLGCGGKDGELNQAMMEAATDGHDAVVKVLIARGVSAVKPAGSSEGPLTAAARGGYIEVAKLLINGGADINETNKDGSTPLLECLREGHREMVVFLKNKGAHRNSTTEKKMKKFLR